MEKLPPENSAHAGGGGGALTSDSEARAGNLNYFSDGNTSTPEFCVLLLQPHST